MLTQLHPGLVSNAEVNEGPGKFSGKHPRVCHERHNVVRTQGGQRGRQPPGFVQQPSVKQRRHHGHCVSNVIRVELREKTERDTNTHARGLGTNIRNGGGRVQQTIHGVRHRVEFRIHTVSVGNDRSVRLVMPTSVPNKQGGGKQNLQLTAVSQKRRPLT